MQNSDYDFWKNKLYKFLYSEGIDEQEFYDYMEGKIKRLPLKVEEFDWGVFPITNEDGILVDIKMVVPNIYDEKSLCVNIHEYVHAYEAYLSLGNVYEWHVEESEKKATSAEKRYLLTNK